MKILVTGATGFIGAHFVESARQAGHRVIGLYRSSGARHQPCISHLQRLGVELHRGDILEASSFAPLLREVDCVCHFAAAFREPGADAGYLDRINVQGTANVVKAAAANGVRRFVHCSTAGIYGQRVSGIIDERTPTQPFNSYERSKVAAEREVREAALAAGMEYVILRPTSVYGPRDERLLKLFRSVAKGRFPLFGSGEGRRHMIYVTDLAEAFLRACTQPAAANQELIVAGPQAVRLHELLQTLAKAANRREFGPRLPLKPMLALAAIVEDICAPLKLKPPIYRRRMDFYLNDAAFDSRRAQAMLGWHPKVDLPEGLATTLRDARSDGNRTAFAQVCLMLSFVAL
jgi:nucleoside-diphosphate-sugar epimerase